MFAPGVLDQTLSSLANVLDHALFLLSVLVLVVLDPLLEVFFVHSLTEFRAVESLPVASFDSGRSLHFPHILGDLVNLQTERSALF